LTHNRSLSVHVNLCGRVRR